MAYRKKEIIAQKDPDHSQSLIIPLFVLVALMMGLGYYVFSSAHDNNETKKTESIVSNSPVDDHGRGDRVFDQFNQ